MWLGITRSDTGKYVRQDDGTTPVEYVNWSEGTPAVIEGGSGTVLNADETSEEYGEWYVRSVNERHGTVCERGRLFYFPLSVISWASVSATIFDHFTEQHFSFNF